MFSAFSKHNNKAWYFCLFMMVVTRNSNWVWVWCALSIIVTLVGFVMVTVTITEIPSWAVASAYEAEITRLGGRNVDVWASDEYPGFEEEGEQAC